MTEEMMNKNRKITDYFFSKPKESRDNAVKKKTAKNSAAKEHNSEY
jgi:hypothetical protein